MDTFNLAEIFQDHMVLQKGKKVAVFGQGRENQKIVVEMLGMRREARVKSGRWIVFFPPQENREPFSVIVSNKAERKELKDVVLGRVYLAGGQSNMSYELADAIGGDEVIRKKDFPEIRYYHTPRICYEGGGIEDGCSGWVLCNSQTVGRFSAVAYFFAARLQEISREPVGIIGCNWGGTPIYAWCDPDMLPDVACIKEDVAGMVRAAEEKSEEIYREEIKQYKKALEDFEKKVKPFESLKNFPVRYYCATRKKLGFPWPPPLGKYSCQRPGCLYDNMLRKIAPYTMQGVLWYQGCSDVARSGIYEQLLTSMMKMWRNLWEDDELYFFVVQLAMFDEASDREGSMVGIREAQYQAVKKERYAVLASAVDLGEVKNIHPFRKKELGERLAYLAGYLFHSYMENPFSPEICGLMETEEGYLLQFRHAEGGLIAYGGMVQGFTLRRQDGTSIDAKAEIWGNEIMVEKEKSPGKIVAVEYGWKNYIMVNVYNTRNLPLLPFCRML